MMTTMENQTCQCGPCKRDGQHTSDCAVHNPSALPIGECTCGAATEGKWADIHAKACPAVGGDG